MRRVETANAAKPQEPTPAKEPGPPLPDMPAPPKSGALKVPKVEVDGIKDPKLKPPKKKDLKLGLDRSAKDSMDRFSDGPEEPTEKTEAAGNFDSRGLGLGSGASLIPVIEPPDQKDKVDPDGVDADVNAVLTRMIQNLKFQRLNRNSVCSQWTLKYRRPRISSSRRQ